MKTNALFQGSSYRIVLILTFLGLATLIWYKQGKQTLSIDLAIENEDLSAPKESQEDDPNALDLGKISGTAQGSAQSEDASVRSLLTSEQMAQLQRAQAMRDQVRRNLSLLREIETIDQHNKEALANIDVQRERILGGDYSHKHLQELSPDEQRQIESLNEQEIRLSQEKMNQLMLISNKI